MTSIEDNDLQEKELNLTVNVEMNVKNTSSLKILRDLLKMSRNYKGKMCINGINIQHSKNVTRIWPNDKGW